MHACKLLNQASLAHARFLQWRGAAGGYAFLLAVEEY